MRRQARRPAPSLALSPLAAFPYLLLDAATKRSATAANSWIAPSSSPWRRPQGQTLHPRRQRRPERSRSPLAPLPPKLAAARSPRPPVHFSDDHPAGRRAHAVFPAVPWQRCQFHLQQNAQAYVPRLDQRAAVAEAIRSVFNSPDRPTAEQRLKEVVGLYAKSLPNSPLGWKPICLKASPSSPCRSPTRPDCGPATLWNGSTRNSNAYPRRRPLPQRSSSCA